MLSVHSVLGVLGLSMLTGCAAAGTDRSRGGGMPNGASSGASAGGLGASSGGTAGTGGHANGTGGSTDTGGATTGAGGSTSGTGGAGTVPHEVLDCAGLAAVDQFEDITPPGASGGVLSVATDPTSAGTIYAGTDSSGIYKSTNCGANWLKVNTGNNGDVMDSGLNWTLIVKADDPTVLFGNAFEGRNLGFMRSTNGGVDWESTFAGTDAEKYVDYGGYFQSASVDPTNPNHIVVTFHADCLGSYAPYCLGETTDAGDTWRLFKGPASGWVEGAAPFVLGPKTILLVAGGIQYTSDGGANWELVDQGEAIGQGYIKGDGTYLVGGYDGIRSSLDGHDWTLLDGAPAKAVTLVGDGKRLFAGVVWPDDSQPYWAANESAPRSWTHLKSPVISNPTHLSYDPDHHVLYAPAWEVGLFRVRTQ